MNKVSYIKERIKEIAENSGLTQEIFFLGLGVTAANFRGKKLETGVNSDVIEKIVSLYPHINLEWLITGNGDMQKTTKDVSMVAEEGVTYNTTPDIGVLQLIKNVEDLQKRVQKLELLLEVNKELNQLSSSKKKTNGV